MSTRLKLCPERKQLGIVMQDALSGGGGDGDGRQCGGAGYEGAAVDRMHGLSPGWCVKCTEPGGKPICFLLGIVSVMARP
jgi:hypothetical protein